MPPRIRAVVVLALLFVGAGFLVFAFKDRGSAAANTALSEKIPGRFYLTADQWRALTVQPVEQRTFHSEFPTEGKITIDENRVTRVFPPYAGRVTKLLAAPGDTVQQGQLLFVIEAADSVDAQKDFVSALTVLNKARSQVKLAQVVERRMTALVGDKAVAMKDLQESQANLTAAENDVRSAEIAVQAARNRLRLIGKTDAEIDTFENTGAITPEAPVYSPLAGTVLQRKVGPGQYVNAGASDSDPIFLIGDTSKVWLAAYVRESDAAKVKLGQRLKFTVLSYPGRVFETKINYISPSIDPGSRRLLVRATVDNPDGMLKPEMFAGVTIITNDDDLRPAVPLEAVIYEGGAARIWVVHEDNGIELRQVALGITNGQMIQVLSGVNGGERVITRGSLFIDRMTSASSS
jgi:cobalt-zinc-cadmium efflux system membrane fusion protein